MHGIKGPIFLPKKKKIYTITRSPHIYNLSKEGFEMCVFTQLFTIDFYKIFKKEYPIRLRTANPIFYELYPFLTVRGQPKLIFAKNFLVKKAPSGISLKFTFK